MGTLGPTSSHDGLSESEGRGPGVRVLCPEGSCSRRHPRGTPVRPEALSGLGLSWTLGSLPWVGQAVDDGQCRLRAVVPALERAGAARAVAVACGTARVCREDRAWEVPTGRLWPPGQLHGQARVLVGPLRNMSPAWWASGQLTPVCPPRAVPATLPPRTPSCQQSPATQPRGHLIQWAPVSRARASGAASSPPLQPEEPHSSQI